MLKDYQNGLRIRSMTSQDLEDYLPHLQQDIVLSRYDIQVCINLGITSGQLPYVGEYKGQVILIAVPVQWTDKAVYYGLMHARKDFRYKGQGIFLIHSKSCNQIYFNKNSDCVL